MIHKFIPSTHLGPIMFYAYETFILLIKPMEGNSNMYKVFGTLQTKNNFNLKTMNEYQEISIYANSEGPFY